MALASALAIALAFFLRHPFPAAAQLAALVRAHAAVLAFGLAYALLFFGRQRLELLLVLLAALLVCVLPLRLALGLAIHGLRLRLVALAALGLRVVGLLAPLPRVGIALPLVAPLVTAFTLLALLLPLLAALFALCLALAALVVVAAACRRHHRHTICFCR